MDYLLDYTRPMTAEDFRAWRAHVRYDVKKAARHLNVTPQDIAAFEAGTRPIDAIAQDCCRIAEIAEHRRAERRRAARDEPPFDPDAEPPIDPDGLDPRKYTVRYLVDLNSPMTPELMRVWRDHIAYTAHQAGAAMCLPAHYVLEFELGERPISGAVRDHCRVAEVWEWRKSQRRVWKKYWRRRGMTPPPPCSATDPGEAVDLYRQMTADEFRRWQSRLGWSDEFAALYLSEPIEAIREYASGERPISTIVAFGCRCADLGPRAPARRAPWRIRQ